MLPPEPHLELREALPAVARPKRPPLLFIHGGYCDAWCWAPYFLPWFAARGHRAYALSLRGHGTSGGAATLFLAGLDDYAADVEQVAARLPAPPVLIGHSMGAAIVERLLATHPLRAAALLAPLPPAGLLVVATRLAASGPGYLVNAARLEIGGQSADVLRTLRPYYFSADVDADILLEAAAHLGPESTRALIDLSLRLHWQLPERGGTPLLVMGAEGDRICTADDVRATARHHGAEAVLLPGLAHMLMLENDWERPARVIADWLDTLR